MFCGLWDDGPGKLRKVKAAQRRGARIIVTDHRKTETVLATGVDWFAIRPGTDGALALAAIKLLDFVVVVNRFPTADSAWADLILPATTGFEISSFMVQDGYVQYQEKMIEPLGEAHNDYLIFAELAKRLGYENLWPQTEEEMIKDALSSSDIDVDQLRVTPEGMPFTVPEMVYHNYKTGGLRKDGQPGFETPTGKFEFASVQLKEMGYDALPVYKALLCEVDRA